MTEQYPWPAPPAVPPAASDEARTSATAAADVRAAVRLALAVAVLGALLGLLWSLWSPPGPAAEVLGGGRFGPDETESFIAGDGRYLVLTAAAGLAAALVAWFARGPHRGPVLLIGGCVGAAAGALLTELVGHLTGGGSVTGKLYRYADGTSHRVTLHLPLSLHLHGLRFVEPALVALVYGMIAAFATRDDLDRPDPKRDALVGGAAVPGGWSVGAGYQPQDRGRHGDAPGPAQQGDLAAQ